jgi:hypothetical protein
MSRRASVEVVDLTRDSPRREAPKKRPAPPAPHEVITLSDSEDDRAPPAQPAAGAPARFALRMSRETELRVASARVLAQGLWNAGTGLFGSKAPAPEKD